MSSEAPIKEQKGYKAYKGLPMEGVIARWYARQRGSSNQRKAYEEQARQLIDGLRMPTRARLAPAGGNEGAGGRPPHMTQQDGADVLEVAPGPGYVAIELARLGAHVAGLDISRSFVEIASANARQAGVHIEFRQGDAARMPYDDNGFDLIVCQAAFKNFSRPVDALNEMHRVLRPGGTAVVQDMNSAATNADIDDEVSRMGLAWPNAVMTKLALIGLRRRAYSPDRLERLGTESGFGGCAIRTEGIGLEVRLTKRL